MNKFQARFIELVLKKVIDEIKKIKTSFLLKNIDFYILKIAYQILLF